MYRQIFPEKLCSGAEILEILKCSAAAFRENRLNRRMEVYLDRGKHEIDIGQYLAFRSDLSLQEYYDRIDSESCGREFTLAVFGCQVYEAASELWKRARAFLEGLYAQVGWTVGHADLDLFVGNYRRTPAGIHRDAAANFSFVIDGSKEMVFWPGDAISSRPNTADYLKFDNRILFQGTPGDMMFWPPEYWHMAVSDAGWSATLNLAIYITVPFSELLSAVRANKRLSTFCSPPQPCAEPGFVDVPLPESLVDEVEVYRDAVNDPGLLDSLRELWVRRVSAGGFTSVPKQKPVACLSVADIICKGDFPIVICRLTDRRLLISANGHAIKCSNDERIISLVKALNAVRSSSVAAVLDEITDDPDVRQSLCTIIRQCESFGALTIKHADPAPTPAAAEIPGSITRVG